MTNSYAKTMLQKYRTLGAVIDTNLLLLNVLGSYDHNQIGRGRLSKYTNADYHLLSEVMDFLYKIVATPNIITEVDNLARQGSINQTRLAGVIRSIWPKISEVYTPSETALQSPEYGRISLTDTIILKSASEHYLVLTDDFTLYSWLQSQRRDAININHIRTFS